MLSYTFSASERLKSRKIITTLFQKDKSQSFGAYPLRLVWISADTLQHDNGLAFQAGFSVPKKAFKRANARNLLRRRMREAYRLHKHILYDGLAQRKEGYALMWLYTSKETLDYQTIEKSMIFALKRLVKEITQQQAKVSSQLG